MKKNIKVNFIPLQGDGVQERIDRFTKEIILTYINGLNCSYDEKIRILYSLSP